MLLVMTVILHHDSLNDAVEDTLNRANTLKKLHFQHHDFYSTQYHFIEHITVVAK